MKVGIVIPTYRAKHHLQHCLPPLLKSPIKPRVLIVDSSSDDGTIQLAKELGAETLSISQNKFNHGTTREMARKHLNTDIVVMVTQDAYAIDETVIETLIEPLLLGKAAVSYARQLPHKGAGFLESFHRDFNYPSTSQLRNINDVNTYGIYTYFCSNTCAAYLNSALDEVGGFPKVLTGEDTVVTAKLLKLGYSIAYVAEACVRHSHNYSLWQEFQRYFDTGYARKEVEEIIPSKGSDEKRGRHYFTGLLKKCLLEKSYLLPYALLQTLARYSGYRIGRSSLQAPLWWKKSLSSQHNYWIEKS